MGSFKVKLIKKFINNIDLAIETGTCFGNGTRQMARLFHKVITIELDETLHNETRQKLENEGYNNIQFLQGDSGVLIEHLSREISKPALFYLDAHWSGDASVDWDNSEWKGYKTNTAHLGNGKTLPTAEQQVPLDREINAISKNFKNRGIIYIDDLDKFSIEGKGIMNKAFLGEDYSHLNLKNFRKDLGTRLISWRNIKNKQLIISIDKIPRNPKEQFFQAMYYYTFFRLQFFFDNFKLALVNSFRKK